MCGTRQTFSRTETKYFAGATEIPANQIKEIHAVQYARWFPTRKDGYTRLSGAKKEPLDDRAHWSDAKWHDVFTKEFLAITNPNKSWGKEYAQELLAVGLEAWVRQKLQWTLEGHRAGGGPSTRYLVTTATPPQAIDRVIKWERKEKQTMCGAKCRNAKGPNCDCICEGKYHGAGMTNSRTRFAAADIDLKPTAEMAANAARGLELREKHGKGGTAVGVARARDIKNRANLSPSTVKRMHSFFSRHEGNQKGGEDDAGYIAWLLWGGDAGKAWAARKSEQIDKSESARFSHDIRLPKGKRRLNIDEAHAALAQMGYKLGTVRYDPAAGGSVYKVTQPNGSVIDMPAAKLTDFIYEKAKHMKIGTKKTMANELFRVRIGNGTVSSAEFMEYARRFVPNVSRNDFLPDIVEKVNEALAGMGVATRASVLMKGKDFSRAGAKAAMSRWVERHSGGWGDLSQSYHATINGIDWQIVMDASTGKAMLMRSSPSGPKVVKEGAVEQLKQYAETIKASRAGAKAAFARDIKVRKGNFTDTVAIVGQNGSDPANWYAGLILRHKDGEEQVLWMKHGYKNEATAQKYALQKFDAHVSRMSRASAKAAFSIDAVKVAAAQVAKAYGAGADSAVIRKYLDRIVSVLSGNAEGGQREALGIHAQIGGVAEKAHGRDFMWSQPMQNLEKAIRSAGQFARHGAKARFEQLQVGDAFQFEGKIYVVNSNAEEVNALLASDKRDSEKALMLAGYLYKRWLSYEGKANAARHGAKARFDRMAVANEILRQLGGGRFMAMVGGKNALATTVNGKNGLQVQIGRGAKNGINRLVVLLDEGSDTYDMQLWRIGQRGLSTTKVWEGDGLYAEDLARIFTDKTGFYTSFSRAGAKAAFVQTGKNGPVIWDNLFVGHLGNGWTLANKGYEVQGDYERIANISYGGEIRWAPAFNQSRLDARTKAYIQKLALEAAQKKSAGEPLARSGSGQGLYSRAGAKFDRLTLAQRIAVEHDAKRMANR